MQTHDDYALIRDLGVVAQSTISGWRKQKRHPAWVTAIYEMQAALDECRQKEYAQRVTIKTLSNMLSR